MNLELKVPPPVQALIFGFPMWVVDKQFPIWQIDLSFKLPLAIFFVVAAVALVVTAMLTFRRASTTVDPFRPEEASELVVHGVFSYSRNPMYISLLLVLTGWTIWLGSPVNIILLIFFVTYITAYQIKPEERALSALFGEAYEDYRSKVRRWV